MLAVLPIHSPLRELIEKGIKPEHLWGRFHNEDGTFTIHNYVGDTDADDLVQVGDLLAEVKRDSEANRICAMHNATVEASHGMRKEPNE